MTVLMTDPIDHWLDLPLADVRRPLRAEMFSAFNAALDTPETATHRRAYWTGLGTGYAIAFGLVTREALSKAQRTPGAAVLSDLEVWKPSRTDEETSWACGVLYGYWMGTSEHPNADECATCGQRILKDLDDFEACDDGIFCPIDCKATFHANGPSTCEAEVEL